MMFDYILNPTRFSEVPLGGVIRVFHELVKRSMIPQVKSKQNALLNLRGIVDDLGALEDNGLKKITLSAFHFLARNPLSSTDRITTNLFPTFPEGVS